MDFIFDRAKSLISKKVGAAVVGESVVATAAPHLQGLPLIAYILGQALVDAAREYRSTGGSVVSDTESAA